MNHNPNSNNLNQHLRLTSMRRVLLLTAGGIAASAAVCCRPAAAQDTAQLATPEAGAPQLLQEVTVKGYHFLSEDTSGITSLPLPIEKVPQSISEVSNDFAKAADLKNSGEIAQYTAGAQWASYSPSYGNQIWLRGFSANYAIDGLTVGDQITEPDAATLQRYEVVKGPASVVYGAQSPGGIVNLVSKSASPNTPSYLEALGGSFGRWRVEGQLAGALDDSGAIRGIGVAAHEQSDSFVDFVHLNKTVVYGGLDFDLAQHLTGYVRTSYQRTEDTPYNGLPTYTDGSLLPVSSSFFIGGSAFHALAQATRVNSGLSWAPSELWSLDLKGIYQYTTHGGRNSYNYGFVAPDGGFAYGGENFNDWNVKDFTVAVSAIRRLDDIGLKDSTVSANVRYQQYRYYDQETFLSGGEANINEGDAAIAQAFNAQTIGTGPDYLQDQRMHYLTASTQAVIKVANPLTLVGGIADSRPTIDLAVNSPTSQNFDPGNQVNYRLAAILQAARGLNLYVSYSESYQPNLRLDADFRTLPPVEGRQYEVGTKYLANDRILLTVALFQIRESNVAVYDTTINDEALYKVSDVRHRGLELEATGTITRGWQIRGGVALLDPKVTNDPENPVNNGETRPLLVKTSANLFTTYQFRNGLAVSGGARYSGPVKTDDRSSTSPTPDIRAYTVADAALSYSIDKWLLQANLKNLFDQKYNVGTPIFGFSGGLFPGEPRSFAVSVRRDF